MSKKDYGQVITIRIPTDLANQALAIAKAEDVSRNKAYVHLIGLGLGEYFKRNGKPKEP